MLQGRTPLSGYRAGALLFFLLPKFPVLTSSVHSTAVVLNILLAHANFGFAAIGCVAPAFLCHVFAQPHHAWRIFAAVSDALVKMCK